ncbi:MAG: hypothetical protein Q8Q09_20500 [Deltaproteobacteria bacterium]|nr:hypothetical protein [Deltaproteobacteria bacterium]
MACPRWTLLSLALCACSPASLHDAVTHDAAEESTRLDSEIPADVQLDAAVLPLAFGPLVPWRLREARESTVRIETLGGTGPVRVFAERLPPGAQWDEVTQTLRFTPDFTQGGESWVVLFTARTATESVTQTLAVSVEDTIHPPDPTVARRETGAGFERLFVRQITDDYLDSPGLAGRSFDAVVTVPTAASATRKMPVRVALHGLGTANPGTTASSSEYRIYPHDPSNTYWWGYADSRPASPSAGAQVPAYTARRVLHLLDWVQRTYAGADADRTYITGSSMGGAGAATMGLLHARHFCFVDASLFQAIPKNHRPARVTTLTAHWGAPSAALTDESGMAVWDRMDLTRVISSSAEARGQYLEVHHSKDDDTVHFGAVVFASALTGVTLYQALQRAHVGYLASWDEGSHGPSDPVLGSDWWSAAFNPITDATTRVHRAAPFVAFSRCSADRDAGDGSGNGRRAYSSATGFAGVRDIPGDTGWSGDIAGTHNRLLRWDSTRVTDTLDELTLFVHAVDGAGQGPPRAGYPTRGDRFDGVLPVRADVTPRRVQRFYVRPGERIRWVYGDASGVLSAGEDGAVTVPAMRVGTVWTALTLRREE